MTTYLVSLPEAIASGITTLGRGRGRGELTLFKLLLTPLLLALVEGLELGGTAGFGGLALHLLNDALVYQGHPNLTRNQRAYTGKLVRE